MGLITHSAPVFWCDPELSGPLCSCNNITSAQGCCKSKFIKDLEALRYGGKARERAFGYLSVSKVRGMQPQIYYFNISRFLGQSEESGLILAQRALPCCVTRATEAALVALLVLWGPSSGSMLQVSAVPARCLSL